MVDKSYYGSSLRIAQILYVSGGTNSFHGPLFKEGGALRRALITCPFSGAAPLSNNFGNASHTLLAAVRSTHPHHKMRINSTVTLPQPTVGLAHRGRLAPQIRPLDSAECISRVQMFLGAFLRLLHRHPPL